jgi:uncharacterized phage protein gp47/JayE
VIPIFKTDELKALIIADLEAALSQTIPLLPRAFNRVIAASFAGLFTILNKYVGFIFLQLFVDTASPEDVTINGAKVNPLDRWGSMVGKESRTRATRAEVKVEINVTTLSGFLQAGTPVRYAGNGYVYTTTQTVSLDATTKIVPIRASGDQAGGNGAGAAGNVPVGATVSFVTKPDNVEKDATVTSVVTTAADAQSPAEYRQEIKDRFRRIPMGGAYHDYWLWAIEVPGIVDAYPYRGLPGQIDVYSQATVASSGSVYGVPTSSQLADVLDSINLDDGGVASRRPVGDFVNSLPIDVLTADVNIYGLQDPAGQIAAITADMTTAVENFFATREPYIEGLTSLPRTDLVTVSALSGVLQDVAETYGAFFERVEIDFGGGIGILTAYTLDDGQKIFLDTFTVV